LFLEFRNQKKYPRKNARGNDLRRLATQFYGEERIRFLMCDESFGLLKY